MRTTMIEISRTLDPDTVTARLLTTLISTVGADTGMVIHPDGAALHPHDDRPATADPHLAAATADIDTPRFGPVAAGSPFATLLPGAKSWLAVPLHSREHHVGLLVLGSPPPNAFHDDDLRIAAALAEQGMVAYDNAQLFTRAEHLATTDALTALHNRRHFFTLGQATYRAAEQQHQPLTAIMLDIDHFKIVNDTHGHGAGDDVIHEVAARLTAAIRGHDLLGRYGGEEFALLLPDTTTGPAAQLAERLRHSIAATPIPTRVGPIPVTISLGTAQHHQHDTTLETLLGRADHALYEAKQAGRNRVALAN
jgi:diguanylate cyclase (GGDEF)-like protein